MSKKFLVFAVLFHSLLGCAAFQAVDCRRPPSDRDVFKLVSILKLLTSAQEFHLNYVITTGVAEININPDFSALYLHREDFDNLNARNAISLEVDRDSYSELNGKYAVVQGCFRADRRGYLGQTGGTISKIERFEEMYSREQLSNKAMKSDVE